MPRRVGVACSGGRDSIALLHATVSAARGSGVGVVALHVHHGLSPQADGWLRHVESLCLQWTRPDGPVELRHRRLSHRPPPGDSIEAWARNARYAALAEMAHEANLGLVLLAHHRRDQAETWFLQALRGAGVDGLSGMPASVVRDGIVWVRPWRDHPREAIDAYVQQHGLAFVDDDSNASSRFARNRLRHDVWPALVEAFPHAETSFAQAADWAAEARACLADLADQDLGTTTGERGQLSIAPWLALSVPRRSNALRAWVKRETGAAAPASLIVRLLDELPVLRSARWEMPGGQLHLHRGLLTATATAIASTRRRLVIDRQPAEPRLSITGEGDYPLPGWGGVLSARAAQTGGLPTAWLAHLELRPRQGGERFQAGIGRPPRSLKRQYQAAGLAAWERDGPLVFSGGQLLYVPGLGIDARAWALPGQPQLHLEWKGAPTA